MNSHYDVIIVGAGPAGSSCAYMLRQSGLKIALIDKAVFPRDKICGDALSTDVIKQLSWMDESLANDFGVLAEKHPANGLRIYAPNGRVLEMAYRNKSVQESPGYVSTRKDFDHFLLTEVKKKAPRIDVLEGFEIREVRKEKEDILLVGNHEQLRCKFIVGADGAHSVVSRYLTNYSAPKDHYCAGLRQYWENVSGFHPDGYIELHFVQDLLPGYFWIFPLPDNKANVGLGILSSEAAKRKVNLKEVLGKIIREKEGIKERFENAKALEEPKGFGLPIGSKKRDLSGDHFLLTGDAASLIDPFTGEGIANAIRSGRVAADHIQKAFETKQFDAAFNKQYDRKLYGMIWKELRVGRSLQMMLFYPRLFNFVVKKASKNPSVRKLITAMLDDVDLKKELARPGFYLRLLFGGI